MGEKEEPIEDARRLVEEKAKLHGSRPLAYFEDRTISYSELDQRANQVANTFKDFGIGKGDKVCIMLWNCPEYLFLWFGLAKLGAVMVPLNVHMKGEGLKFMIENSETKLTIFSTAVLQNYGSVRDRFKEKFPEICLDETGSGIPEGAYRYEDAIKGSAKPPDDPQLKPSDPMAIIYTSGTTGLPKGVVLPHYSFINTGREYIDVVGIHKGDRPFTVLPLYHVNAEQSTVMGSLVADLEFTMMRSFSASQFWEQVRTYKGTVFNYLGTIISILWKLPESPDDKNHSFRVMWGAAAPAQIWRQFEKRFNVMLLEGYGSTETGTFCTCNRHDGKVKVGSVGPVNSFSNVEIVDDFDGPVPPGVVGEFVVRPTRPWTMFLEYYKNPVATVEAWRNLWFHTGDLGYKDEDGHFYFVDRKKHSIRRRGENISSELVERGVNEHPAVLESAAVGVPSELGEEDVKIYVVLKEGQSLTPEELVKWCEGRMAYFMVPRYAEFVKELPKTPTLRVQKLELKKLGIGNAWDREKARYKLKR